MHVSGRWSQNILQRLEAVINSRKLFDDVVSGGLARVSPYYPTDRSSDRATIWYLPFLKDGYSFQGTYIDSTPPHLRVSQYCTYFSTETCLL